MVTRVGPVVSHHVSLRAVELGSLMSSNTLTDANVLLWEEENDPAEPAAGRGLQVLRRSSGSMKEAPDGGAALNLTLLCLKGN